MKSPQLTLPILIAFVLSLSGCTSTLNMKFDSDPPGANLYVNGSHIGYAPVTLKYPISESDRKSGYIVITTPTAKWASGATAEWPSGATGSRKANELYIYFTNSFSQGYTFYRPDNIPGRHIDVQFGYQLQQNRAAEEAQALKNLQNALSPPQQAESQSQSPQNPQLKCSPVGDGSFSCQ